jgi:Flp pilus assembly secretin CpaC
VIGGLVDQQTEESSTGIPFLKDIPILGYLFGTRRESVTTSELFLFLTPYVIASDEDVARFREEIEGNAELLEGLMPIRSLLPPALQVAIPDSLTVDTVRGDTIRPDTLRIPRGLLDTTPGLFDGSGHSEGTGS